jgi:hypothetical protein
LRHAERRQKDSDLIIAQLAAKRAQADALATDYERAVQRFLGSNWIDVKEQIDVAFTSVINLPSLRDRFLTRLAAFIRESGPRRPEKQSDIDVYNKAMFSGLVMISHFTASNPNLRVDLGGANLSGLILTGLKLGSVSFCEANLTGTDLRGAFLRGAKFHGAIAKDAVYDDTTDLGDEEHMQLAFAGAMSQTEMDQRKESVKAAHDKLRRSFGSEESG